MTKSAARKIVEEDGGLSSPVIPFTASNTSDTVLTYLRQARRNNSPEACFYLGSMLQAQGRYQEAIVQYRRAIELGLSDIALFSNLGLALSGCGRQEEAVQALHAALRLGPNVIPVHQNLGLALRTLGRFAEAETHYRYILAMQPDHLEALADLGEVLRIQGGLEEAEACYCRVLQAEPNRLDALLGLGRVLAGMGRHTEAEATYAHILVHDPENAEAFDSMGVLLYQQGRYDEAASCYRRAISVNPQHAGACNNLAVLLMSQGRALEAEACYRSLLAMDAGNADAHNSLGTALYAQERLEEAEACYLRALSIDPQHAQTHNNLGVLRLDCGQLGEAEASYRLAITHEPGFAKAHFHYVQAKKVTWADAPLITHLEGLLQCGLREEDESHVNFALGKCYDDLGEYARAFAHFERGNELERRNHAYEPALHAAEIGEKIAVFSREFLERHAGCGSNSETPVFIVGMPRSGTTLLEQIISSHPQVFGAGEQYFMDSLGKAFSPESAPQAVREMAQAYETQLRGLSPDAVRITDKMPQNFLHLGLIRLCFPRARIIHCKRDALDTCLSIYTHKFTAPHPYAHNLHNLAFYYTQYQRLMQHWLQVMPGQILEVQYEDLVCNQEQVSRQMLEFCGLEWDERCLAFERNERIVHTASNWQVRQPMYASAIGRWKNYESFLGPLLQQLGG